MSTAAQPDRERRSTLFAVAALVAYFALAHASVLVGYPWVAALVAGAAGLVLLVSKRAYGLMALLLVAIVVWLLAAAEVVGFDPRRLAEACVYLPSVVIPAIFSVLFGRSLLPRRTPVLTALATLVRGELDERTRRYTRAITWVWTCVMLALAIECAVLAMYASLHTWSLFANGINHLFIAAVFVVEYLVRRRWLSELAHPGFAQFLRNLRRANLRAALHRG